MHDPSTLVFRIGRLEIWHVDPCKDGTDDSCAWFIRQRHGDKAILDKIIKHLEFDWDPTFTSETSRVTYACGLFYPVPSGMPHMSIQGVVLNLFYSVAFVLMGNRDKAMRYLQGRLAEIMFFAENPCDSLFDTIILKYERGCGEPYTKAVRDERLRRLAGCIYSWILNDIRPWYRHPRWHVWHWKIRIQWPSWMRRNKKAQCACGEPKDLLRV